MTTWQDQQPLSRRALRESERALAHATMPEASEAPEAESAADQQIWSENSISEPLNYETQARGASAEPEAPLRRPRQSGSSRPDPESAGYRLREFSPEARGTSFSSTQPAPWTPPSSGSEDLDYRTSIEVNEAPETPSPESYSVPPDVVTPVEAQAAHFAPSPTPPAVPEEHTLTRRELRERRDAAAAEAPAPLQEPVEIPAQLHTERTPIQSAELAAAMAEFDSKFRAEAIPALVEPPQAPVSHVQVPPEVVTPPVPETSSAPPEQAAPAPAAPAPAAAAPAPVVPPAPIPTPAAAATPPAPVVPPASAPTPAATVAPASAPAPASARRAATPASAPAPPFDSAPVAAEPLREVVSAPEVYSAPAGHWSTQAEANDQADDGSGPHKRDLSASDAITTSALVMPNFSATGPTTGPISGTGQILMTGSIDLPRSLGINGLHPSRYDRSDIDSIIDAGDREDAAPDSAPVRAVRAVSTYTSSQGIIATKRPRDSNLPMVLSITAGVMMVGVVVLVVAGMIFKIF